MNIPNEQAFPKQAVRNRAIEHEEQGRAFCERELRKQATQTCELRYVVGERTHGFVVETAEPLPEIDGNAYTMRHEASGARLLYLQNSDDDKAFSIGFKTPPADDTGVFHILEHSVLCGSDKFPVKEPFVNLLKTSMQTFLNAMTFPDKTMYPVASTNEQDLMNLADVYMDAVLHPAIYRKRTIFEQEGWHYDLAEADGGKTPDAASEGEAFEDKTPDTASEDEAFGDKTPGAASETETSDSTSNPTSTSDNANGGTPASLCYNGVVFNEMKGALSDPDSVLHNALTAALFPHTAYRFESGGDPRAIVDLTYEGFLDHHARHYRLDNSYLTLYGNLDPERFLQWLDERYLTPDASLNAQAGRPNALDFQQPLLAFGTQRTMSTAPENACMALGYVVGTAHDRQRVIAADILLDALMGSNEAPLKRALLDAGLADDALAYLADAMLQPFVVLQLKGLRDGGAARFRHVVETTVAMLTDGRLDHALLEASLSHAEFVMREFNTGYSDGVMLAMTSLSGWLYDDGLATAYLRYEDDFAFLREQLDTGYFEDLMRQLFLENPHAGSAEIVPVENADRDEEAERLAVAESAFSQADYDRVEENVAALRRAQEEPDTPEALATLPLMSVADLGQAPDEPPYSMAEAPLPCLRHDIPTRGIAYAYRYYGLECLSFEELPYVTVLAMVLGKLDTAQQSASQLDTLVQSRLGNLSFFAEVHEAANNRDALLPKFVVSASSLSENVEHLAALPHEILSSTAFDSLPKIKDVLVQKRVAMEQGFAAAGHNAAMARAASYYLPAGVMREQLGGVDFYRFLKDLLAHFDERGPALSEKLKELSSRLFRDENLLVSFTGADVDFERFWDTLPTGDFDANVDENSGAFGNRLTTPAPQPRNEAFIVPSDVTYSALAYDRRLLDEPYSGTWLLASRILSYDYLWN
ncbi:MAG: insulinase family protein, partial [Eggerthellaceae bacterium]|nr:insulinase family protein [Eggerthellaceae bacterium]